MISNDVSLKFHLSEISPEFVTLFDRLEHSLAAALSEGSTARYRYPSARQAVSAQKQLKSTVDSVRINSGNLAQFHSQNNDPIASTIRLSLYGIGKSSEYLGVFVWTRRAVVKDLGTELLRTLEGINIVSLITLARAILEQVAALTLASKEILPLFAERDIIENEDKFALLIDLQEIITKRSKGTRIDWETYLSKSLRVGQKKSYKPNEGEVDTTATDLMNSIDLLSKKVKGARKAYEFASEFAHPNVGPHTIFVKKADFQTLGDNVKLWDRVHDREIPERGLAEIKDRLFEFLEITTEAIELLDKVAAELECLRPAIEKWSKEIIRAGIEQRPMIFHMTEPCPCFSGKKFRDCCGRRLRKLHKRNLS